MGLLYTLYSVKLFVFFSNATGSIFCMGFFHWIYYYIFMLIMLLLTYTLYHYF